MLVDVSGDGDVSAGAVALDGDAVLDSSGSGCLRCESPDVEAVATGRDFDVVAFVSRKECGRLLVRLSALEDVIKIDAANAFSEDEAGTDTSQ